MFDKGASSKVLTMASGGRFYDLGSENHMAFQPLRNIHKLKNMEFAMDWVMGLIAQEDENLAKDVVNRKKIYDALISLSKMEVKMRTISTLVKLVQIQKLKEALRVYSQEGIYGSYFDNNSDVMEDTNFLTFEMGAIMEKPKVLLPILEYLFFKIESEKLGKDIPTLIILDECWVFLRHERMKAKIEEWLKVLRKANAEVVFATQSLNDIEKSSIAATIKDACMTKIFLPNENALSTHKKLYEGYNLSQIAISTLDKAFGQRQYLYNSKYGTRLFELNLSKLELAYVGAGDDTSKSVIENLSNIYLEKYSKIDEKDKYLKNLNKDYLKYKYEDNKIKIRVAFDEEERFSGLYKEYYPDGNIMIKDTFVNGENTREELYYKNGQLMGTFADDEDLKLYYNDGKLVMTYNDKTGESIIYHENGNPLMITNDKESAIYNENKEMLFKVENAKAVDIGTTLKKLEDGSFELVKSNKVVAKIDANGELIKYLYSTGETMLKVNEATGVTEFFFKNGNTFMKEDGNKNVLNYKDGKPLYEMDGDSWKIYNEEGEKIAEDFELVTNIKKVD